MFQIWLAWSYFKELSFRQCWYLTNKVLFLLVQLLHQKGATSSTNTSRNRRYDLTTCQGYEAFPNVVTGVLQIFSPNVYYLVDLGSTLHV